MTRVQITPEDRCEDLPGYTLRPHHAEIVDDDGAKPCFHHIEQGPTGGPKILLKLGTPSWSWLCRKMILDLGSSGARVLAVDLVGLNRS